MAGRLVAPLSCAVGQSSMPSVRRPHSLALPAVGESQAPEPDVASPVEQTAMRRETMDDRREDGEETRPQRGGEGATTRFGMEEKGGAEVPATGGPVADQDQREDGGEGGEAPVA